MTTGAGGSIEGTFVRDAGVTRSLPTGLGIEARIGVPGGPMMMNHGMNTFRLAGLTSPIHIRVDGLPDTWAVKAITVDGVDVTDRPIDVRNGQNASARIVLTDRVTEVTGLVIRAKVPGVRIGESAVVFGAGPIGLATVTADGRPVRDAKLPTTREAVPGTTSRLTK